MRVQQFKAVVILHWPGVRLARVKPSTMLCLVLSDTGFVLAAEVKGAETLEADVLAEVWPYYKLPEG